MEPLRDMIGVEWKKLVGTEIDFDDYGMSNEFGLIVDMVSDRFEQLEQRIKELEARDIEE